MTHLRLVECSHGGLSLISWLVCLCVYVCVSFLVVMLLEASVTCTAGSVCSLLQSIWTFIWICGFDKRLFTRPCSWESPVVDGYVYGRGTDLSSQSGTSGIERHCNYRKTLLKMTLKMSRGKKMIS